MPPCVVSSIMLWIECLSVRWWRHQSFKQLSSSLPGARSCKLLAVLAITCSHEEDTDCIRVMTDNLKSMWPYKFHVDNACDVIKLHPRRAIKNAPPPKTMNLSDKLIIWIYASDSTRALFHTMFTSSSFAPLPSAF